MGNEAVIIDPDILKKKYSDFNPLNHEKYSKLAKEQYTSELKNNPNPVVKITAGGSGSGKSELVIKNIGRDFNGIIYDGTFSNFKSASSKIDEAIRAGKKVEVHGILPRIESAWKFVQKRKIKTGRGVPLKTFIDKHTGFVDTFKKVIKEYPNVKFTLKDTRNIFSKKDAGNLKVIIDNNKILKALSSTKYNEKNILNDLVKVKYSKAAINFKDKGSLKVFRDKGRTFMIASAENPMGKSFSDKFNKKMTNKFRKYLDKKNILWYNQKGKYGNVETSNLIQIRNQKEQKLVDKWLENHSPQAENILIKDAKTVRYDPRTKEAYFVDLDNYDKDLKLPDSQDDFYSIIEGKKYALPLYSDVEKAMDKNKFNKLYKRE